MIYAIILRGAISKKNVDLKYENTLYCDSDYINYNAAYNSILKHILEANNECNFDFFIHCWNQDLEEQLVELYKPKKYLFENNNLYANEINQKLIYSQVGREQFSQVSQALSIKKGCELVESYCKNNNNSYDGIIICRPDVLIMKDMLLNEYNMDNIYVNAHGDRGGDFHFVMSFDNMNKFKNIYDNISVNNKPIAHQLIRKYCINIFGDNFMNDDFIPGLNEEVIRKIKDISIKVHNISIDSLKTYEITENNL